MKNTDLKKFYNRVYKKGEHAHYSKLLFSKGRIAEDRAAVLKEISWRGKRVLDVGCGTGEMCSLIARKGARRVLGIDFSKEAIREAQALHTHPRVSFVCDDVANLGGETFDVIITMGTLEHMDDPLAFLQRCRRMLKSNGSLIVSSPNWANPRGYMLLLLRYLFRAPITRADIHYLTPRDFELWAKKLRMDLAWKTVDHDWSQGDRLIQDFERRLPRVIADASMKVPRARIASYIAWLKDHLVYFEKPQPHSGALGIYHFRLNNGRAQKKRLSAR